MSWVWGLIARVATSLWDRWRTEQASRARGAAEERARALRARDEAEKKAEDAKRTVNRADPFAPDEDMVP